MLENLKGKSSSPTLRSLRCYQYIFKDLLNMRNNKRTISLQLDQAHKKLVKPVVRGSNTYHHSLNLFLGLIFFLKVEVLKEWDRFDFLSSLELWFTLVHYVFSSWCTGGSNMDNLNSWAINQSANQSI